MRTFDEIQGDIEFICGEADPTTRSLQGLQVELLLDIREALLAIVKEQKRGNGAHGGGAG